MRTSYMAPREGGALSPLLPTMSLTLSLIREFTELSRRDDSLIGAVVGTDHEHDVVRVPALDLDSVSTMGRTLGVVGVYSLDETCFSHGTLLSRVVFINPIITRGGRCCQILQAVGAQVRLFWPELNGRTGGGATRRSLWPDRAMLSAPRSHARTLVVTSGNVAPADNASIDRTIALDSERSYVLPSGHEFVHRTPRLRVYDRSRSRRARDSGIGEGFVRLDRLTPRGARAIDRSKGDRHHGTEADQEDGRARRARRVSGDRRRSHRTERSPGNGRERARNLRQDRSWVPPVDVHASDRGEGHDLGFDPGAGERNARSLHRASFARRPARDRGFGRLAVDPQRGAIVRSVAPLTIRRPFGQRALSVRETGNVLSCVTTPPCPPPKEESRVASKFVRALAGGAHFSSHDRSHV